MIKDIKCFHIYISIRLVCQVISPISPRNVQAAEEIACVSLVFLCSRALLQSSGVSINLPSRCLRNTNVITLSSSQRRRPPTGTKWVQSELAPTDLQTFLSLSSSLPLLLSPRPECHCQRYLLEVSSHHLGARHATFPHNVPTNQSDFPLILDHCHTTSHHQMFP